MKSEFMGAKTEIFKILETLNSEELAEILNFAKQIRNENSMINIHQLPEEFSHPIKVKQYIKFERAEIYDDSVS